MKKKLESDSPLDAATCSPSSDTPGTDHRAYTSIAITKDGWKDGPVVVHASYARKLERERDEARQIAAEACAMLADNGFETNYPPMPWDSDSSENAIGEARRDKTPPQQ